MSKKLVGTILAVALSLASTICLADSAPSTTIRFAMSNSATTPHGRTATKWVEDTEAAREKGETSLAIAFYPNGQLGSVSELLEQVQMGETIAVATDAGALKAWAPELGILECPYMFESTEEIPALFETPWFKEQCDLLEQNGIKVLSAEMIYGSRHIMCKVPVRTPSDLKGVKIRVPNSDLSISMMEAMGGVGTPMSLSEVYASIQQGVIDGMENPIATHLDNSMWEVCNYLSLTGHQITISWYVMSADVFNSLSDQDQNYLMTSAKAGADFFNSINGEANDEALQAMRDKGVTIVDDVDIAAFKEATASVYEKFNYTDVRNEIYEQMAAVK